MASHWYGNAQASQPLAYQAELELLNLGLCRLDAELHASQEVAAQTEAERTALLDEFQQLQAQVRRQGLDAWVRKLARSKPMISLEQI